MEFVHPIRDRKKIDAMKKYLRGSSERNHCLFILGINSGLRISDLLKLRILDVVDGKKIKERICIREKKTGKNKEFPIGTNAKRAIVDYLKTRVEYSPNEPLFISRKNKRHLGRWQAYKIINDAAKAVGIKEKIGTHSLKKTFGYHAYKEGKDITLIQKLFNHSAPSVTLAYIGITQEDLDNVYLELNL
ncbi:site-specific integrase [Candidatus Uabimicrobium amorphum]|uniref:Integrase n=1 Tax=Uabimicrobium amorphum TaxID=2596890 RepID=A0A5S9ISY6_UABAM|nr:site-specific integrase [Candidatus Uabimicrobium amorphum]BBM86842.1 integrase [Candidatus Uabimicrobium amorphum]